MFISHMSEEHTNTHREREREREPKRLCHYLTVKQSFSIHLETLLPAHLRAPISAGGECLRRKADRFTCFFFGLDALLFANASRPDSTRSAGAVSKMTCHAAGRLRCNRAKQTAGLLSRSNTGPTQPSIDGKLLSNYRLGSCSN